MYISKRLLFFAAQIFPEIIMPEHTHLHTMNGFTRFFEENRERFLMFAYSYIRNHADAEDILMESMIALWEHREKWSHETNAHALLLTIIKNKALNYLAHLQVRYRTEENITDHTLRELDLRIATLEDCHPERIFDAEIQAIVEQTLSRLPEQSRRIFMMSRQDENTNKEIAEQLGLSVKSVEYHITKVLKLLRTELKDYLFSLFF